MSPDSVIGSCKIKKNCFCLFITLKATLYVCCYCCYLFCATSVVSKSSLCYWYWFIDNWFYSILLIQSSTVQLEASYLKCSNNWLHKRHLTSSCQKLKQNITITKIKNFNNNQYIIQNQIEATIMIRQWNHISCLTVVATHSCIVDDWTIVKKHKEIPAVTLI